MLRKMVPERKLVGISKKRRANLPKESVAHMKAWLFSHRNHPYPSEEEKAELIIVTGLTKIQLNDWFANARRRILKD